MVAGFVPKASKAYDVSMDGASNRLDSDEVAGYDGNVKAREGLLGAPGKIPEKCDITTFIFVPGGMVKGANFDSCGVDMKMYLYCMEKTAFVGGVFKVEVSLGINIEVKRSIFGWNSDVNRYGWRWVCEFGAQKALIGGKARTNATPGFFGFLR